jgi:chorismate dehydratase
VSLFSKHDPIHHEIVAPKPGPPRLRVAAIRFLNPAPLMWDFEHPPMQEQLAQRYALSAMMPSECAERLALPAEHERAADIGLVPITAYAETPGLLIIPGCTVASKGAIRSLLLVHRESSGIEGIRTVAADTSSRATLAYVQILFRKFWKQPVSFLAHGPDLDRMLEACDAAVLIGDPALLALEDREAREERTGERLVYLDLGTVWREFSDLPWISAFWAVRESTFESKKDPLRGQVREDFLASRNHGLTHLEDLVREWSPKIAIPRATIRTYLNENIHYLLDSACVAGIEHFYRLAADCELMSGAPTLRFL